jgi:hypothetical protein
VTLSVKSPETAALPPTQANQMQVQIEAPLVFRGTDAPPAEPLAMNDAGRLPLADSSRSAVLQTTVLPPAAPNPPQRRGFLGKMKGFLGALFR